MYKFYDARKGDRITIYMPMIPEVGLHFDCPDPIGSRSLIASRMHPRLHADMLQIHAKIYGILRCVYAYVCSGVNINTNTNDMHIYVYM